MRIKDSKNSMIENGLLYYTALEAGQFSLKLTSQVWKKSGPLTLCNKVGILFPKVYFLLKIREQSLKMTCKKQGLVFPVHTMNFCSEMV